MDKPRVRVYLDDNPQPIIDQELPTDVIARYAHPRGWTAPAHDSCAGPERSRRRRGDSISGAQRTGHRRFRLAAAFDPPRQSALYRGCFQHRRPVRSAPSRGAFVDSDLGLGDVACFSSRGRSGTRHACGMYPRSMRRRRLTIRTRRARHHSHSMSNDDTCLSRALPKRMPGSAMPGDAALTQCIPDVRNARPGSGAANVQRKHF